MSPQDVVKAATRALVREAAALGGRVVEDSGLGTTDRRALRLLDRAAGEPAPVVGSLNATSAIVDDFHAPLGIETSRRSVDVTPWREALRDPAQRLVAGKEAGQKAAMVGAAVLVSVATVRQTGGAKSGGKS